MPSLPKLIELMFSAAGWQASGRYGEPLPESSTAAQAAALILEEFGGLMVGDCGPGTERAASDVHFFLTLRLELGELIQPWQSQTGPLAAFATAHHDHMVLFVGPRGTLYVLDDPANRLYSAGDDLGELMHRLLLGYALGPEVSGER